MKNSTTVTPDDNSIAPASVGCTGISLKTIDDKHVVARTIEWGEFDLNSKLVVSGRGCAYTSQLPNTTKGLSWKNKYGFVGISVSQDSFIGEGMNEQGLNAGLFYFKGYGSLSPIDPQKSSTTIVDMDVVRWLLGNFKNVDEVKRHFNDITVAPVFIDDMGAPSPTAHWRVTDDIGGSIVIEIMHEGVVTIHDNTVGVITNSPDFNWHVTNLNNYIHIEPGTKEPSSLGPRDLTSMSTGTSLYGLPGDYTSTSRFVRSAVLCGMAPPLETATEAVSQAFHILNSFDIPIGTEFSWAERDHIPRLPSATQWTAVSDLSNRHYYFKTMHDSSIKRINLKQIDFHKASETTHEIDEGSFSFREVTL